MTEAFRGECLSLAAQLEQYAKIDGTLPGVVAAMQESAAALRLAAKPDDPDAMNERRAAEDAQLASNVREACAKCVPTNWCDPLLTGPDGVGKLLDGRMIEKLLRGIQDRVRALSTTGKPKKP